MTPRAIDRRTMLRRLAVTMGAAAAGPWLTVACRDERLPASRRSGGSGSASPGDEGDLLLPDGFRYRVLSRQGDPLDDGGPTPSKFDGMAAFAGAGGTTILLRNHENTGDGGEVDLEVDGDLAYDPDPPGAGGVTKLVVTPRREVAQAYAVLGGTTKNCAGGRMPWGTWVSCEETFEEGDAPHGYMFEVPAHAGAAVAAEPIAVGGRMQHEAVAWWDGVLYETEDQHDGGFYRVLFDEPPGRPGDLARASGRLQALRVEGADQDTSEGWPVGEPRPVTWVDITEPDPDSDSLRAEARERGAASFDRPEGAWAAGGKVFFSCTDAGDAGLGQIWALDTAAQELELLYESPGPQELNHPDNIVVAPSGDIFICEDAPADVRIRRLSPDGTVHDFAAASRNPSEFAGACFDPSGRTLFVNQQGEPENGIEGVTYAIWGPWGSL